jgi:hypothetical protein
MGGPNSAVEVDETFVGGRAKNMHKDKRSRLLGASGRPGGAVGKAAVQGILDRDSRQVRAKVMPNVRRETLQTEILKQVKYGSNLYTDDAFVYGGELKEKYIHEFVNKTQAYVRGQVHVNGLENFWSLLKRGLNGTYVAVEPYHLSRYVDEQVFRYNNRATKDNPLDDSDRFALLCSQIVGRRLTYDQLTAKEDKKQAEVF